MLGISGDKWTFLTKQNFVKTHWFVEPQTVFFERYWLWHSFLYLTYCFGQTFCDSRWRGTKPRNLPFWYSGLMKGGKLPKPASLFFSAWEETVAMYCEPKCFSPQKCQPNWLNLLRSQVQHSPLQETSTSKSQLRTHSEST